MSTTGGGQNTILARASRYHPLLWSLAGDGCSMDGPLLLLSILFPFALNLTEIWRLEMPSACIQRDPLPCSAEAASLFPMSPPCSLISELCLL